MLCKNYEQLNDKQRKFVIEYIKTGNKSLAYARAYGKDYDPEDKNVRANASRLANKDSVIMAIAEKRREIDNEKIADIIEVKEILTGILKNNEEYTKDRLKAADMLLKSSGGYTPETEQANANVTINLGGKLEEWAK